MAEEKQSESETGPGTDPGAANAPVPADTKDHDGVSTPPGTSGNTDGKAETSEVKGAGGIEVKGQSDYNHFVHAPLSPSFPHHFNGQPYYYQPQHTPNSPATPNLMNGYDVQSLLSQQQQMRQQYPAIPPLSPGGDANSGVHEEVNLSMGTVPPASPLFPGTAMPIFGSGMGSEQIDSSRSIVPPSSPGLQYLSGPPPSPVVSYGGMYSSSLTPGSPEPHASWSERTIPQQQMYPPTTPTASPHVQSIHYQQSQSRRSASFDGGELLPPPVVDDSGPGVYATSSGGTLFSQQQPWAYNPTNSSPYGNALPSSIQQQQAAAAAMRSPPRGRQFRGDPGGGGGGPGGVNPYYPAATPGPPIQTTHHNKGPEGANLFIFHIPNHFTNLDMWHLFCHYGNLLSVRIMVEKETGRSRGFGFVSYDAPEAAALAIKELNGFVIGNKRLKVQHKQIRHGEQQFQEGSKPPPLFPEGMSSARSRMSPPVSGEVPPTHHIGVAAGQKAAGIPTSHHIGVAAGQEAATPPVHSGLAPKVGLKIASPSLTLPSDANAPASSDNKRVESSILSSLESIGEALPEVSK